MLQQTRVETVIPYWERFLARFPDVASLARAEIDDVYAVWTGLGYYSRARNLKSAAESIVADHGGQLPDRPRDCAACSGIGRYTAGAVASIAFDREEPLVDGNVVRVFALFWRHTWLPVVSTSTPAPRSLRATLEVMPAPLAVFSPLAMTKSTSRSSRKPGSQR